MKRIGKDNVSLSDVELARAVRDACAKAALAAYENAAMDGLCHEGAWEVAMGAIRSLDVERIVQQVGEKEDAAS